VLSEQKPAPRKFVGFQVWHSKQQEILQVSKIEKNALVGETLPEF